MPGVSMETRKRSWGVNEDEGDTPTGTCGGWFVSLVFLGLHRKFRRREKKLRPQRCQLIIQPGSSGQRDNTVGCKTSQNKDRKEGQVEEGIARVGTHRTAAGSGRPW